MLKTKQKGGVRRGQRLHPGPFSLTQPSRAKAQVQLNRLGQQLKKKLKHGTTMDIVDSVTSEIGCCGLIILFLCVISVCWIIIVVAYSGNEEAPNLREMHNKIHPDHVQNVHDANSYLNEADGAAMDHVLDIDPEHWPHHLRGSESKEEEPKRDRIRDINDDNDALNDRHKMEEYLENKKRNQNRSRHPDKERRERKERRRREERRTNRHNAKQEDEKQIETDTNPEIETDPLIAVNDIDQLERDEIQRREETDTSIESNWNTIWNMIALVDIHSNISIDSDVLSERSYRIKSSFLHAWHGYAKHALGHDEIHPVSDLPGDSWGGLGSTLIDSLDTMMIMQIKDEFKVARDKLQQVKFNIDLQVSFFETTIRHLGGLIGAYELSKLLGAEDKLLLKQAVSLGEHLLPAFNTKHGIPKSMVNLQSGEIKNYGWTKDRSVLSEVGSNQLEFYALSEYTNDGKYYTQSANVYKILQQAQDESTDKLYPRLIETDTATFPKNEKVFSLGGMSDSFYEYTLKLWILTNYNDKLAIKMYVESITEANDKLLRIVYDQRRRKAPYLFYGEQWYSKFRGKMEELQCFMPGVLALGSYHALLRKEEGSKLSKYEQQLIDDREKHLKLAHVLLESCVSLYTEMPTGLAPESIEFTDDEWNPKEMKYQLRPETLESLFILHSLTGNEQYREWAWNIFESIEKHCKTDVAFSGIEDVTEIPAKQDNQMQSYVMAETFKYLFLLFDEYAASLLPLDQFVFNTEAHPIRIISDIKQYKWYKPEEMSNDSGSDSDIEDEY